MISAIALLFTCQLVGEIVSRGLGIPVPGPVIGLAMLFVLLWIRNAARPASAEIGRTPLGVVARTLLANLSILFVPAGVGITRNLDAFREHGFALAAALIVSTVLAMAATALTFRLVASRLRSGAEA